MYIGATELSLILPANVSIGTNTAPWTLGEVASLICEVSAEIDSAVVAAGYGIPIPPTATVPYGYVQRICKMGVGWQVLRTIFPDLGGPGDKTSIASDYRTAYEAGIKAIREGKMPLPGASTIAPDSGAVLPRGRSTSDAPSSIASGLSMNWEP